jgi:hypothetical protein
MTRTLPNVEDQWLKQSNEYETRFNNLHKIIEKDTEESLHAQRSA